MKKVFYISLCLFVLVGIFWVAYNFVFRNNVTDPIADPAKLQTQSEAGALVPSEQTLANPINETILGPSLGKDGHLYYFSLDERSLKRATLEGKDKAVLLSNLPGFVERLVWSPDHQKVLILIRGNSGTSLWHFADLATKTLTPLRAEMGRLVWSNLGDKILYQYTDATSGARSLNLANPDGSNWQKLADLSSDSYLSAIPKSTFLSFWSRPSGLVPTILETVSLSGSDRKTLLADKRGADFLWSPVGEHILGSVTEGGLELALMNKNGGEYRTLGIPTLITKVAWNRSGDTIYYALPGALPEGALLPDEYWSRPLYTQDTFWKLDLATGKKTRLVEVKDATQTYDSTNLFLSPNEDMLFFTDRKTNRLYRIDL